MSKTIFDYKNCRSEIFLQYGVDLDETSMSILFIMLQEHKRQSAIQNDLLETLIKKVNTSQRSLQVDFNQPRYQAFWFGIGKWGMAVILAVLFAGSYYWYYIFDQKSKEKLPVLYLWYKKYYENTLGQSKKNTAEYLKNNPIPQ